MINQALMISKHHPHTESMGGAGSVGPKAKFFHNKQLRGIFLQFTDSQTAASPFTPPVLLHTHMIKVLSAPPASQNGMATGCATWKGVIFFPDSAAPQSQRLGGEHNVQPGAVQVSHAGWH